MGKPLSGAGRCRLGGALLCLALAGCSLLSLKSPERPLSQRDLNARILTRELEAQFVADVARCAQDMLTNESDPQVQDHALRWQLAAVAESRRAATRMTPMMSLVDSWALGVQMQAFAAPGGAGTALFGNHQQVVRDISAAFAADTAALAQRLLGPREFADYQQFIAQYAQQHPLQDLTFARASVLELWSRDKGTDASLVDAVGTIPQAMADLADRAGIYGNTEPGQVMLSTRLALRDAGYTGGDVQTALRQLDERLARLSTVAETTRSWCARRRRRCASRCAKSSIAWMPPRVTRRQPCTPSARRCSWTCRPSAPRWTCSGALWRPMRHASPTRW
jgi:hypothetical protein